MSMVNRHLLVHSDDIPSIEYLLEPSRVTVGYENLIQKAGLKTMMILDILMEPFELKVGFREMDFFTKLNLSLQSFLTQIQTQDPNETLSTDTEIDIEKELRIFKHK
jgi:hypothetical protein